jgi:hypothetical protein
VSIRVALLLACLGLATSASAQRSTHLVPEVGPLAELREYDVILSEAFALPFPEQNVVARVVLVPSFRPEAAVGIREEGDGYEVFLARPDSSLWSSGHVGDAWSAEAARTVAVVWHFVPLADQTAEAVGAAWERAILDARYPDDVVIGFDGVTAHFSRWVWGRGMIAAKTWSPNAESLPGALLDLGHNLRGYAEGHGVTEDDLAAGAGRVLEHLEAAESGL